MFAPRSDMQREPTPFLVLNEAAENEFHQTRKIIGAQPVPRQRVRLFYEPAQLGICGEVNTKPIDRQRLDL